MTGGIVWNARGVGNMNTIARIHQLPLLHACDFFVVLERMVSNIQINIICHRSGYQFAAFNSEPHPKIWVFWRGSINFICIICHPLFITFSVGH